MNHDNIVVIGSGNLATQLSLSLKEQGWNILQVYSRTTEHAKELADKLNCSYTSDIQDASSEADIFILSIKDDALNTVIKELCQNHRKAIFLHTAGSVPMKVFQGWAEHFGVLYPMQSFSKTRRADFHQIPCFIEASDEATLSKISLLAHSISPNVTLLDSDKRSKIHLAAVLASNLSNHCYRLAERVLEKNGIDFNILLPLIQETARKVTEMPPRKAQTGPMVRYDTEIMNYQLSLIDDERTKQIYKLMAESIHEDSLL